MMRIRKDVWSLQEADETLLWYARAVAQMRSRSIADPKSWRFQAAIHEYDAVFDPLAVPGESLPSEADQATFWNQCQHASWFFLPWHRMYLHHFEKIVAAEIVALGGPDAWALPYWNYSNGPASRLLPPPFRNEFLDDGSTNPLYVEERNDNANQGLAFADELDVDLSRALPQPAFSSPLIGGTAGFGGPETWFSHAGDIIGILEWVPHGTMHGSVAGLNGWMGGFQTAALDPIFWLHHANLDRLWQVWLNRSATNRNPANPRWLAEVTFPFYDADSTPVTMWAGQVLDTRAAPLEYEYDDVGDPLAPVQPADLASVEAGGLTMAEELPPEMVGATTAAFDLDNDDASVIVPAQATTATHAAAEGVAAGQPPRVYLNIENLTSEGQVPSYDVYVNVPEGEDPRQHPLRLAGRLAMFGVEESSRSTANHAGSGLTYALDITDMYRTLVTEPGWDPDRLRVSFVRAREWLGAKVRVGRVSLYLG